mgnify:CR=1 FL=1
MATTWKGARWIWTHTGGPYNNWHCFRKDFQLEVRPKQARAAIAVDSKYQLWVNGKLIIREVGLPDACGPFESIHVDGRRARRLPPDGGRPRGFTWVRVPAGKHEIVAAR